jgi:hypothetical protein
MGKKGMSTSTSYRCCWGDGRTRSPAPPRCVLKTFGGDMNIDDFRNMDNKIKLLYPPCDHRKSVCEEVDAHMVQKVPGTFPSTMIS